MLKQYFRTVLLAVLLLCTSCEQQPLGFVVNASTLLLGLQPSKSLQPLLLPGVLDSICNDRNREMLINALMKGELRSIRTDCWAQGNQTAPTCAEFKSALLQFLQDICEQASRVVNNAGTTKPTHDSWHIGGGFFAEYVALMEEAAGQDRNSAFDRFREHPASRIMFEDPKMNNVLQPMIDHIERRDPAVLQQADAIEMLRVGSSIGGPSEDSLATLMRGDFPATGLQVAPVHFRYLSVAVDIRLWFGRALLDTPMSIGPGARVVEVGGGFGGQAHACLSLFQGIGDWMIFDLPAVERVQRRWLSRALAPEKASRVRLGNTELGGLAGLEERIARGEEPAEFDLFMSNYALSELKPHTRAPYVSSLIARSRRGWIAWNIPDVHWILGELERLGKENVALYEERPYRATANVVVSWGLPVFAKDGAPWSGWDPRAVH